MCERVYYKKKGEICVFSRVLEGLRKILGMAFYLGGLVLIFAIVIVVCIPVSLFFAVFCISSLAFAALLGVAHAAVFICMSGVVGYTIRRCFQESSVTFGRLVYELQNVLIISGACILLMIALRGIWWLLENHIGIRSDRYDFTMGDWMRTTLVGLTVAAISSLGIKLLAAIMTFVMLFTGLTTAFAAVWVISLPIVWVVNHKKYSFREVIALGYASPEILSPFNDDGSDRDDYDSEDHDDNIDNLPPKAPQ